MEQGQHYVPQIYLQRFAYSDNGDLYGLKIKGNYPGSNPAPKPYNKSGICKLTNFYNFKDLTVLREQSVTEANYVEKHGFPYENTELKRVFDLLEQGQSFFHSDAQRLLEILFNIKRRNPAFLSSIQNFPIEVLDEFVESEAANIKEDMIKAGFGDLPIDYEKVKEEQKEKLRSKDHRSDIHKQLLVDTQNVNEAMDSERIATFMSYQFTLFTTIPEMPFITSDNPGFTLAKENQVFNLEFDRVHSMAFPISSLSALRIDFKKDPAYSNKLIYKSIKRKKAGKEMVDSINQGTACTCLEYIYGISQEALTITHESWKRNNC